MLDGQSGHVIGWNPDKGTYTIFVEKFGQPREYRPDQVRPEASVAEPSSSKPVIPPPRVPGQDPWIGITEKKEFLKLLPTLSVDHGGDPDTYKRALDYGKQRGWLKKDGGRKTRRRRRGKTLRKSIRRG